MPSTKQIISALKPYKLLQEIIKKPSKFFDVKDIVMHGTNNDVADEGLDAMYSQDGLIYSTDDIDYALFLAVIQLSEKEGGMASVGYKGAEIHASVDQDFVNGQSQFVKGKIYIFNKNDFKKTKSKHEFVSKTDMIAPLGFVEVDPRDMKVPVAVRF